MRALKRINVNSWPRLFILFTPASFTAAFVDAEQRRAAPVIAYLPWARIVCEIAQDYKCDLTYEAAVFAAMYKLVEAKVVGVLAAAGAIAQNAGRMYVCENDVTLAKKLKLKPGRGCR